MLVIVGHIFQHILMGIHRALHGRVQLSMHMPNAVPVEGVGEEGSTLLGP